MRCPTCKAEGADAEFKGFRAWFAPIGKRGPSAKGGRNTVIRDCPDCGVAFLPKEEKQNN
jgi:hypothetical protein